jgi:hypothetical protein
MPSEINPDLIDSSYPVAGQDNSTQGFRDNFAGIKTNFQYTENEINDLQTKVLLKSSLDGDSLNNNLNDNLLYAARIQDFSFSRVTAANTTGAIVLNYASAHYQTIAATTGSVSISFINWPANGNWGWLRLQITVSDPTHTLTLPAQVTVNATGIQGLNPATNVITFATAGTYSFDFETYSGGSTITITDSNQRLKPLNNSSEDLAASAAASLATTVSYFSTATAETATLAAGTEGQVKVLAMYADLGDMVITVTNAGWKTSGTGTITFDTIGDACTLQYINGKWFCIGNNGASFA